MRKIFMTGGTGVLGQDLVKKLLKTTADEIHLLVRSGRKQTFRERIEKFLTKISLGHLLNKRVFVYEGDVTQPRLGLSDEALGDLKDHITDFFHIAALTALNGSEEDCNRINIEGTEHSLEIAKELHSQGSLKRFVYFSTAYAAGSKKKCHSLETELPEDPAHANFYESSKYKAETNVREAMAAGLPTTIIRPSIVVGDSKTGEVSDFNVIYPFFKLYAHGALRKLVSKLESHFNIVPIDFVIDATCAITQDPSTLGKAFHLVSQEPPTIEMLLNLKDEMYPGLPEIEVIDPDTFDKSQLSLDEKPIYEMLEPYMGYSNDLLTFDTTLTEKFLSRVGIKFPRTDKNLLKTLIDYAAKVGYLVLPTTAPANT